MFFRKSFLQYFVFFVIFSTFLVFLLPADLANAAFMSDSRERDEERVEEEDNDDRDRDDVRESVDDLDDDEVDDFTIPVLFGVSLSDITSNFGDPRGGGSREHEGLDMLAPEGTPIVSPTEAVVTRIGRYSGAGKFVITRNPGGEVFYYYHLDDQAEYLDEGDEIDEGDLIGYVGETGNAEGGVPHLHFEIREDRDPKDPYPRVSEEYSLEEKMEILEDVLDDADDEDELAETLVENFLGDFFRARAEGIDLPEEIEDALPESIRESGSLPDEDLTLGDRGASVRQLQAFLLETGYINISAPTGYFGPITREALQDYQEDFGITPASGYYGAKTRAALDGEQEPANENEEVSAGEGMTEEELRTLIAELAEQVRILLQRINALEG